MAVDMLELSEMGSLTESRLGNKCFIDDEDEYSNLFGSKKAKRNDARRADEIRKQFEVPADKRNNCDWLQGKLTEAENMVVAANSKGLKKRLVAREVRPLTDAIANLKTLIANNKCAETKAQQEAAAATQQTLAEINKAAQDAPQEDGAAPKSNTMKYVLFGVGGLAVVVLLIAVMRRN